LHLWRINFVLYRTVTVTVIEAHVLHLLEDRGRIKESVWILAVDKIKQKCFQFTTKRVRRSIPAVSAVSAACSTLAGRQQRQLCRWFVDVSAAWRVCHATRRLV